VAPGPLDPKVVAAVEGELQKTAPDRRARDANELAAILDDLGDLTHEEIAERSAEDAGALIKSLLAERRITEVEWPGGRRAWISAADAMHYAALATDAGLERVTLRLLRTRGPVTADWLAGRYGLTRAEATATLDRLTDRGVVRRGEFLAGVPTPQYVHIAVLEEVQRRQVHARRVPRAVASAEQFSAMLLRRHHLHPEHRLAGPTGVLAAVELLQGEDFPARVWELDLLVPRVEDYQREWLDRLGLAGEIVWTVFDPRETAAARPGRVGLALRDNAGWLRPAPTPRAELDARVKNVLLHLQLRGASFAQDLAKVAGLDTAATLSALWELFWAGLVTPDTFSAIVAGSTPQRPAAPGPSRRRPRRGARRAPLVRLPVIGRWSALAEEEALSPEEREEARAHLLLARYGVLSREMAQGDWSTLRHTLLRMEYGGEVVRGYFVEGLSGEQYALEETLRELEKPVRRAEPHVLVTIADPANLWGRVFTLTRSDGQRAGAARIPTTWLVLRAGRPVLLAEGQGRSLTPLAGWERVDFPGAIRALQSVVEPPLPLRRVRRLDVEEWESRPVRETEAFDAFVAAGFSVDGPRLSWDGHLGPRWRH
jgi:ATP-dependent Lhr-like helicase